MGCLRGAFPQAEDLLTARLRRRAAVGSPTQRRIGFRVSPVALFTTFLPRRLVRCVGRAGAVPLATQGYPTTEVGREWKQRFEGAVEFQRDYDRLRAVSN